MRAFAALYHRIDAATSTKHKSEALQDYLRAAIADETRNASAAWAVYFLAGGKPRQMVPTKLLRQFALDETGLPEWLFEESYQNVGDLAETLTLLLPSARATEDLSLDAWMNGRLLALRGMEDAEKLASLRLWVAGLPSSERLPFFKLTTGAFRIGVSQRQVVQALSDVTGIDAKRMAQRMMGYTQSGRMLLADDFAALIAPGDEVKAPGASSGQPYPFFLAHSLQAPIEDMPSLLGPTGNWLVEWKFDGIRAQFIHRAGQWWLWSRGEELVSESFPEIAALANFVPSGAVLDGELLVVKPPEIGADVAPADAVDDIRPFAALQQRLGRKNLTAKILRELPVALIAYDLLEYRGDDQRRQPQRERRARLEEAIADARAHALIRGEDIPLRLSPALKAPDWRSFDILRERARAIGAEGMMIKGQTSEYGVGRRKSGPASEDLWWKWKLNPMSVDAVLVYAQRGHGRRSGVYSDYTFAVWSARPEDDARILVPFAKAYSGLTDEEMRQVDAQIRKTTVESFGPVRSVRPTMVFELGFEGISLSKRHKSGIATRFPRMLRWRRDKPVEEANTIDELKALLPAGAANE
ncbi:MAG TPA: ATP-dependent DNA ligase [Roseiarcus sp.]|nr:ATP-dependent DNA ligase [Roseiarcus sp.]